VDVRRRCPFLALPLTPATLSALSDSATEALMDSLRHGEIAPGLPSTVLYGPDGGKMFGTLVVRSADGTLGSLKAFSGQLDHRWDVDGFVPPLFDRAAREAVEPRGESCVRALTARVIATATSEEWARLRAAKQALAAKHAAEEHAFDQRQAQHRALRARARAEGGDLRIIGREARDDETKHREFKTRLRQESAPLDAALARFERRLLRLKHRRVAVSRIVSWQLYDTYVFENRHKERKTLRELFAPKAPPSGAGDCAAPKLIAFALGHGLEPLALTEFWWGKPPRNGKRTEGTRYPPCEEKCAPLLEFLLKAAPVSQHDDRTSSRR